MTEKALHDAARAAIELREQLASDKRRLAFFMGAGTSMAVEIPGIEALTTQVKESLDEDQRTHFEQICKELGGNPNVEDVLNRVRLYRELLGDDESKTHKSLTGKAAKELDTAICGAIHQNVSIDPPKGIMPHKIFAQWLYASYAGRGWPIEIFTTNYDLLLEKAMEEVGVPYFDGFVGSVTPFFAPESVEADNTKTYEGVCPPRAWTRLWKLHGSVNWYLREAGRPGKKHVTRLSDVVLPAGEELMIFPSREKYIESRKLPFLAYQDRLRRFLSSGEAVLFIIGYSFSDEHLNEILFQGLRGNSRLAVNVLMYGIEKEREGKKTLVLPEDVVEYAQTYRNMSVYGPDKAVIGGIVREWAPPPRVTEDNVYWSDDENRFRLGDFTVLALYLERFIGISSPSAFQVPAEAETEEIK